jgi:hypothetical protein
LSSGYSQIASGASYPASHAIRKRPMDRDHWDTQTGTIMSRSKRSQPITGITTAESEKDWKRDANRKLRRAVHQTLHQLPAADPDALILPVMDEVVNQYSGPKDGKQHFDPRKHPQLMRK